MRRALLAAWTALLALAPRAAGACAVCMSGREDETRGAFLMTTLVLSALPMALVGGFVLWLRRRARALERARVREHAPGRPVAPPALSRRASSP